jgi:hypothetical protein
MYHYQHNAMRTGQPSLALQTLVDLQSAAHSIIQLPCPSISGVTDMRPTFKSQIVPRHVAAGRTAAS